MVELGWLSLAVVAFLCGFLLGGWVGVPVFLVLAALAGAFIASSSSSGGTELFIILTMGAGFVLVLGGGGLGAGIALRHVLEERRKRARRKPR
jgi:hypothetical protein